MVNLIPPPEMADRKTFDWLYQLYEWLSVRLGGGIGTAPGSATQNSEEQMMAIKSVMLKETGDLASDIQQKLDSKLDADVRYAAGESVGGPASLAVGLPFGTVDPSSTATDIKATVPGITALRQNVYCYITNGVVTSASGWTLNVNGLGARPVYSSLAAATRTTTIFNAGYSMLFIFNEARVEGGCWDCFYGYNSDTNTIGYNIRRGNGSYLMHTALYRYMVCLTKDEATLLPVNAKSNTTATTKPLTTETFNPFGPIYYYGTTTTVNAGEHVGPGYMWTQYSSCDLRYAFNVGKTLVSGRDVYIVAAPQSNGMAKLYASPISQTLPTTEDGLIYIHFGHAFSAYQATLDIQHPIYQFKGGKLQLWTGA